MAKPEDWLRASPKQRQALYQSLSRLEKLRSVRLDDFVLEATGRKVLSDSFRENFRKGLLSRDDASNIYKLLQAHFPDEAAALDVAAFTATAFNKFLLSYRRLGLIALHPPKLGEPVASHRRGPDWSEEPFEIFEPISFRLRLPYIYQAVIGVSGSHAGWYPLRITDPTEYELAGVAPPVTWLPPSDFIKPVTQGAQTILTTIPTAAEAERRRGSNVFVFVVGEAELIQEISVGWDADVLLPNASLLHLVERLSQTIGQVWALTQLNATGIGPY